MVLTGLTKYRDFGLLLLRVGIGIMFMMHGVPKLMAGPEMWVRLGNGVGLPAPVVFGFIAAVSEAVGGLCLAMGLFFRVACVLLAATMAGAVTFHLKQGDPIAGWSQPTEMLIVFTSLILIGPGRYSVDKK